MRRECDDGDFQPAAVFPAEGMGLTAAYESQGLRTHRPVTGAEDGLR